MRNIARLVRVCELLEGIIGRHPRGGGDPGFRFRRLKRLDSRLRGNDGQETPMTRSDMKRL
ncbi:hypothetical protein GBZ48_00670 [Azospirillum melinis]|uniref:Transposase n=1 Tax=Azospirillum melinis TaxID=328839 RepID=A0ABX2KAU4_9PROT|nr:hypothetical protein [Azospirillum melinis]